MPEEITDLEKQLDGNAKKVSVKKRAPKKKTPIKAVKKRAAKKPKSVSAGSKLYDLMSVANDVNLRVIRERLLTATNHMLSEVDTIPEKIVCADKTVITKAQYIDSLILIQKLL